MNNGCTEAQKKGKAPNPGRSHLFQGPVQAGTCRKATPKGKSLSEIIHTPPYHSYHLQGSHPCLISHGLTTALALLTSSHLQNRRGPQRSVMLQAVWITYLVNGTARPRAQVTWIPSHALFNIPHKEAWDSGSIAWWPCLPASLPPSLLPSHPLLLKAFLLMSFILRVGRANTY